MEGTSDLKQPFTVLRGAIIANTPGQKRERLDGAERSALFLRLRAASAGGFWSASRLAPGPARSNSASSPSAAR